jgi:hypothetical protein
MPPVIALPDHISALNLRLRSFPEITALVGAAGGYTASATPTEKATPRVSPVRQPFWKLPHYAILLRKAGGPPMHRDAGLHTSRVDLWLYGPGDDDGTQEREAYALWRTVQPALMPPPGTSDMFTLAGVCVDGISDEAEPFPYLDQATGWRVMVAPILVGWSAAS